MSRTNPLPRPVLGDLRVWWIPQIPGKAFHVPVVDREQAMLVLDTLAQYDIFQFENRIKGDYCNAGGLEIYEGDDIEAEWSEWCDHDTGDDIGDLMKERA